MRKLLTTIIVVLLVANGVSFAQDGDQTPHATTIRFARRSYRRINSAATLAKYADAD